MIGCCGGSNFDGVMKSLLVVVEVHKSLPEVKSSTTSRVLQQGLWMECTHTP
jgi:hypothetical protein